MQPEQFSKKRIKEIISDNIYSMGELKLKYGLNTEQVWFESFTAAPEKQVHYIRKMRKNGEELNQEPRILLSTIHGVKGGEADNVVLLTDLSKNTQSNYERYPDDENRLFYVGATRTKTTCILFVQRIFINRTEYEERYIQKQIGGSHYRDMVIQPSEFINKNTYRLRRGMLSSICVGTSKKDKEKIY